MEVKSGMNVMFKSALVTALILLIPLLGNRFVDGWNWDRSDFIIAGILIFGVGLLFQLILNKVSNKTYRIVLAIALVLIFIFIWAELAVGIFNIPGISGS